MSNPLVFHASRLAGVCKPVWDFFMWWASSGPFPLTIPDGGGVRTDAAWQLDAFNRHVSNAKTLDQTPHGRGAAADAYPAKVSPAGIVTGIYTLSDADGLRLFTTYGALGEANGLQWGGHWSGLHDLPHVQVPNWRLLPFPPVSLAQRPSNPSAGASPKDRDTADHAPAPR